MPFEHSPLVHFAKSGLTIKEILPPPDIVLLPFWKNAVFIAYFFSFSVIFTKSPPKSPSLFIDKRVKKM